MKDKKLDLTPVIEAGEPIVVIVITWSGLQKSLLFYEEDSVEALEAGNLLLAKISPQLMLIDNALRRTAA